MTNERYDHRANAAEIADYIDKVANAALEARALASPDDDGWQGLHATESDFSGKTPAVKTGYEKSIAEGTPVQIGSLVGRHNLEKLAALLNQQGIPAEHKKLGRSQLRPYGNMSFDGHLVLDISSVKDPIGKLKDTLAEIGAKETAIDAAINHINGVLEHLDEGQRMAVLETFAPKGPFVQKVCQKATPQVR